VEPVQTFVAASAVRTVRPCDAADSAVKKI
jgi:hypothetical protein